MDDVSKAVLKSSKKTEIKAWGDGKKGFARKHKSQVILSFEFTGTAAGFNGTFLRKAIIKAHKCDGGSVEHAVAVLKRQAEGYINSRGFDISSTFAGVSLDIIEATKDAHFRAKEVSVFSANRKAQAGIIDLLDTSNVQSQVIIVLEATGPAGSIGASWAWEGFI